MSENERFDNLRKRVAKLIEAALTIDPYCKSYEGTWEVMCSYPNYFDDPMGTAPRNYFCITLHCYVLGSGRHHQWTGRTFADALGECEKAVREWEGHDERL